MTDSLPVHVYSGYTVLCTKPDGTVEGDGREGLYDTDTRLLKRLRWTLDGRAPMVVADDQPSADRWRGILVLRTGSPGIEGPKLPQDALSLTVDRQVGPGMIDRLVVANASAARWAGILSVDLEPDFADVQEIGGERRQHGRIERIDADGATPPGGEATAIGWTYAAELGGRRLQRGVRIRVSGPEPQARDDALAFPIDLGAHESWTATLRFESLVDGEWRSPKADSPRAHWPDRWKAIRTRIEAPAPWGEVLERAADDLGALRQWDWPPPETGGAVERADAAWFVSAGIPMFTGLFGRDSLTAGWQGSIVGPEPARGAIDAVAAIQADRDDPWRDEEPGKLIHEVRRGPLSELELIPQSAYYGSQTTPAMFVLALSELWHWTGDDAFLRRHRDTAMRTFEWARKYGDLDDDGFLEYRTRSERGLKNQGWKDSDEAIRYPDGRVVPNPIATVEEQAFHCLALERMAEILLGLDEVDEAERFLGQARALRGRWHSAYWIEDEGFYALALDPEKRQVRTVTSNPGHALGAGIVPPECARLVADRLFAPDLYSGWGIRTLSSDHPSYNPYAYHLGTVWPVEQATFALGLKRYGLDEHADRLVAAMLEAARFSPGGRLPEVLAGVSREAIAVPPVYPESNTPQAWSAAATLQFLQILLGLYPFAPLGLLGLVRPRLPAFIPELTLHDLRIGDAVLTIRFRRQSDGSANHEILKREGRILVVSAPPPQARERADLGFFERLEREALRLAPGRLVRAARIALGLELS